MFKTKANVKKVNAAEQENHARTRLQMAMRRRSWGEMSSAQKVGNIVLAVVETILTVWALLDIKNRPEEQINGKKITWVMTSLIQPVGPIIYFIFGRKREMAEA
jgi:hypothetical protein